MYEINNIYRLKYMSDRFSYIGTLRNSKRFDINDEVFFSINKHDIVRGRIVGIELNPDDNPTYRYKVVLPEELVRERMDSVKFYEGIEYDKVKIDCDSIFLTAQEAKDSAIAKLERMLELQSEEIERYFKQFI